VSRNDQSHKNERFSKEQSLKNAPSAKSDLCIDMLGTSFSITAEEEVAYLEGVLGNYRLAVKSIQESTGLQDPLKLAILTGFLLCDKIQRIYLREAADQETEDQETLQAEQITQELIARIDEVLEYGH
jgi:cell division protein ZapA (FtsZ GTPase activity inhibitor)